MELLHHMDSLQLVYEVVGDPQFLQCVRYSLLQDTTAQTNIYPYLSLSHTHVCAHSWHSGINELLYISLEVYGTDFLLPFPPPPAEILTNVRCLHMTRIYSDEFS